jgi:hypothetical protein
MRLFLDCEWADTLDSELVSLALVSEDGAHRFYAEVSPLPNQPTDWVRAVVYPLLEHGYAARQQIDFTRDLRAFVSRFDDPFVLFDYQADGALFGYALAGFDLPDTVLAKLPPAPKVSQTLIPCDEVRGGIEQYFREHPEHAGRRHHAGVDAEALRWAFLTALENTP